MAFWSRVHQSTDVAVRPVHVPGARGPGPRTPTGLDRIADEAHASGGLDDPDAAWSALVALLPASDVEEEPLDVVAARPLGGAPDGPECPPTLLFATSARLIVAGNLGRPVWFDFDRLQSVGRISAGFPQVQVLVHGPGTALEVASYELAPNKWTGLFWHVLSAAVAAARPDLVPHVDGDYEGLGVPVTVGG